MKSSLLVSRLLLSLGTSSLLCLGACNNEAKTDTPSTDTAATVQSADTMNKMPAEPVSVPLVSHAVAVLSGTTADTVVNGTATFDADSSGKVKLVIELTVPAKAGKSVAVHLHEHGDCGEKGTMAHGHWNPTNAQHGKWGSGSFHLGDIGNVKLDSKGKGKLTITTDLWSLGGEPGKNVLGKAVIVHGGVDDFTTQPTGNAGSRIGCGVIK